MLHKHKEMFLPLLVVREGGREAGREGGREGGWRDEGEGRECVCRVSECMDEQTEK